MKTFIPLFALSALAAVFCPAHAQSAKGGGSTGSNGPIAIDQARAEAGAVTSGDAAGFPVTLSQPGSYRLMSNLTVPDANTTAIVITSPNVTLDFNGFAVMGPAVCLPSLSPPTLCSGTGTGDGVAINLPGMNVRGAVTLANGTVRGMGRHGVNNTGGGFNDGLRVERMFLTNNGGHGALMIMGGVIADSQLSYNGQYGVLGNSFVLLNNLIRGNSVYGVSGNVTAAGAHNVIQGNGIDVNSPLRPLGPNLCGNALCQ
jgi:hypothetical protein